MTAQSGDGDADWTILVSPDGGIRMVAGREWDVEALRLETGARSAYRVSRNRTGVKVEARAAGQSCKLERGPGGVPWGSVLPEFPHYLLTA